MVESTFTEEIADTICERIADGQGLRAICRDEAMPGRRTVLDWLEAHAEFRAKYARAREAQGDFLDEEMQAVADGATAESVQVAKLRIETMRWRASKLAPKKYGERTQTELTGPAGAPLSVEAVVKFIKPGTVEDV